MTSMWTYWYHFPAEVKLYFKRQHTEKTKTEKENKNCWEVKVIHLKNLIREIKQETKQKGNQMIEIKDYIVCMNNRGDDII